MSYRYADLRAALLTDEGQRMFLGIRDRAHALLKEAGAFRLAHAIEKSSGDTWTAMACIDRMVELGEVVECDANDPWGQDRIFRARRDR